MCGKRAIGHDAYRHFTRSLMNRKMQRDGPAPEFTPGQWFAQPAILCALLAAATFIVFWPTAGYDYINLDDPVFVSTNPHVSRD